MLSSGEHIYGDINVFRSIVDEIMIWKKLLRRAADVCVCVCVCVCVRVRVCVRVCVCVVYTRAFSYLGILIKEEITRAIASDPFYLIPRGRNRTPPSSSCPSMYRGLTSRRDTPSTLSHLGLTVFVMDNRATRALLPSRAFAASVQYFTAYLLFGDARLRSNVY